MTLSSERTEERDPPAGSAVPASRRGTLWCAFAVLAIAAVASVLPLRTPAPEPADAPPDTFSAARALSRIGDIASVRHPTGSPAQARVRERLVAALRGLGFEPKELSQVVAAPAEPSTVGAVTDVYAKIPGTAPSGSVLVVAHYDSVPTGPGASDDGANAAAVLEIARALRSGPAPRNDVYVLLTDCEESGSLGAAAFAESGVAGDPRRVAVVNLEARGVSGPALLFETAGTGLAPAVRASGAVSASAAAEVYRVLPNSTDLTVFGAAGMRGLNLAFAGGAQRYHTSHDDIASIDPGSVQDIGGDALAAARHLAGTDLGETGSAATYFGVFGFLVSYPDSLVLPFAALAALGFAALLWRGRRRGLRVRQVARCAGTLPLVVVAAVAAGLAGWWGFGLADPDAKLAYGMPYSLAWYAVAEVLLVAIAVALWYRRMRRRASVGEVATAAVGWFVLIGLALAVAAPSAAYLAVWPALAALAVIAAALRSGRMTPAVAALSALPAVVLLTPVCVLLVPVLGLGMLVGMLVVAAFAGVLAAAPAELLPARKRTGAVVLSAAAAVALALFGTGLAVDEPSARTPHPVSLGYLFDADTGTARWISDGTPEQPVVGRLLTDPPRRFDSQIPFLGTNPVASGPAPAAAAPAPRATGETTAEAEGTRTVRMRLSVAPGADQLAVNVDTTRLRIVGATAAGISLPPEENWPSAEGGWHWGFVFVGPPPEGVDVEVRVRGDGPVPVRAVAVSGELPAAAPPLPADLHAGRWPSLAGQSFAARTFRF
ncbi:M20/M25/M40 family metallo-hydrolase [Amycolatopsis nivea]